MCWTIVQIVELTLVISINKSLSIVCIHSLGVLTVITTVGYTLPISSLSCQYLIGNWWYYILLNLVSVEYAQLNDNLAWKSTELCSSLCCVFCLFVYFVVCYWLLVGVLGDLKKTWYHMIKVHQWWDYHKIGWTIKQSKCIQNFQLVFIPKYPRSLLNYAFKMLWDALKILLKCFETYAMRTHCNCWLNLNLLTWRRNTKWGWTESSTNIK